MSNLGFKLFSPNPRSGVGFCRENSSNNSGWDGQNCGHLVQPLQLFESTTAATTAASKAVSTAVTNTITIALSVSITIILLKVLLFLLYFFYLQNEK
jgi:hypothetical protein